MPSETDVRDWLRSAPGGSAPRADVVDLGAVVRRIRRRRRPRQLAAGATATLAVAAIGAAGFAGIRSLMPVGSGPAPVASGDASEPGELDASAGGGAAGGGISQAPASKLNGCDGTLAEVAPSASGLVLTTDFPADAPADGTPVEGRVVMTNTGSARVIGTTAPSPVVTLSQEGRTLWHSNGPADARAVLVDLGPGESLEYSATFIPVRCAAEDEMQESFRPGLPALPPGEYQVSAVIDLSPEGAPGTLAPDGLITGAVAPLSLR